MHLQAQNTANDVHPGSAVSFGGNIRCAGNAPSGNFKVKFFLSKIGNSGGLLGGGGILIGNGGQPPAPTIKPGDRLIGTRTMSANANSTREFQNTAFVLDANFQQGSYKVKYAIDASNEVGETNESNNVVQMTGVTIKVPNTIDLRDRGAQHHSLSKTEVNKGGAFIVRGDVENGGNLGSGAYKVAFYASLDDKIDPSQDIAIGETSMPGLFSGAHGALDKTVQLPLTIRRNPRVPRCEDPGQAEVLSSEARQTREQPQTRPVVRYNKSKGETPDRLPASAGRRFALGE